MNSKLDDLTADLTTTKTSITIIEGRQLNIEQSLKDMQNTLQGLSDLDDRVTVAEQDIRRVDKNCRSNYETNRMRIDNVEVMIKRNNLVIRGLDDVATEDRNGLASKVRDLFTQKLNTNIVISPFQVYRKGPFTQSKTRSIVYKADNYDIKIGLLSKNTMLKGSNIYIEHDYTTNQLYARFMLRKFAKSKAPEKYKWVGTTSIIIANDKYRFDFATDTVIIA